MADRAANKQQEPLKVLRIGVLQGGKVVQERLVRPGADVTIGESPRNTFVVTAKGVPKSYTLFLGKGGHYQLAFTEDMDGKIALDQGVATFAELRKKSETPRKGDTWTLALTEKSRGKVSLGELTILFQFVPAPPESARLLGATDFRPKLLDDDDPVFLGFLALFSAIAAVLMVYVYNTDVPDLLPPEKMQDYFAELTVPEHPEKDQPDEVTPETLDGTIVKKEEPKEEDAGTKQKQEPKTDAERAAAEAAAAQKKRDDTIQRSKLLTAIIGTRGETSNGQMVEDVFGEQDNKFGNLQDALQKVDGSAIAGAASIQANKGATDGSGSGDASIGDMARGTAGSGTGVETGPGTTVHGRVTDTTDVSEVEGGTEAGKTIKKYRGQVQTCYEQQLKVNPNLRGRLAVVINVSAGRVTSVEIDDNGTGDKDLETCVKTHLRAWRFDPSVTGAVYPTFVLAPSG